MSSNVFMSVLGTNCYQKCNYYYQNENNIIENVHFVQEASIQLFNIEWQEQDKIYILLTNDANELNWKDNGQLSNKKCINPYEEGLETRLNNLKIKASIDGIPIKNGNNEEEIWSQFQVIYELLNENDNLYFDITHSFRSIPMLLMVLLNYGKFLKKINVKAITYGNFEGRNKQNNNSEIIDLTSFSLLQDWTSAANEFIYFGSVKKISSLSLQEIKPLLIESKGSDENLNSLRKLNTLLPKFVSNIQTNRGVYIVENTEGKSIVELLNQIKGITIKPLIPLLEVISKKMDDFSSENDIRNGIKAVRWCLDHGLTQQGITILKETITSFVCSEMGLDHKVELNRNIVDKCFFVTSNNVKENDWDQYLKNNSTIAKKIIESSNLLKILQEEFTTISMIRNDINHAGFKESFITKPDVFTKKLKDILEKVSSKVLNHAHQPI
jgi:CRISPR-associated Csx2 family protein